MDITITNKELKPQVIHTRQFEQGIYTVTYTLDYMQGTIDLRNYKAYAVTSISGHTDITELEYTVSGEKLILTWNISAKTLEYDGVIQYLIRFSGSAEDNTVVWYSHRGILVNRASIDVDSDVVANYPTALQQWFDKVNDISNEVGLTVLIVIPAGETIQPIDRLEGKLYYIWEDDEKGHFEDAAGNELPIGQSSKYLYDVDLNDLLEHGTYICAGTLANRPQTNATYCIVRVVDSESTSRITQEVLVPQSNDASVRMFIRSISIGTSSTTYGEWTEFATGSGLASQVDMLNAQLDKSKFETKCLKAALMHDLSKLWIERLDTSDDVQSTVTFNTELGYFELSNNEYVAVINVESGQSSGSVWCAVDYAGDGTPNVYIVDGSSSTQLTLDGLTDVTFVNQYLTLKVQSSGILKLKSFAWGLK